MKSIAITGISGYIGSLLFKKLAAVQPPPLVVGVDARPAPFEAPFLRFHRQDISAPLEGIFVENGVESAVHLAFVLRPARDRAAARQVDIGGSRNFLNACHQAGVRHILYLSSHTVYGARADNPRPLDEDSPLRPLPDFQYSFDKAETERLLGQYALSHPDVTLTVLRSCPVVGPGAATSVAALMFKPPVMIAVKGCDPPLQFVHEEDLIEIMVGFLSGRRGGIYNVAGDGEVLYSEAARLAGKKMFSLSETVLKAAIGLSWSLRLQSDSPPSGLEFIKYPPVISTARLKAETGLRFRYSSREAVASFLEATP